MTEADEKMFNSFFLQCCGEWLKWATAFHIAKFLKDSAHFRKGFTVELYSSSRRQGRDQNVKNGKD